MSIPLVSLGSSSPSDLAKAVSAACTSSGFLYITDHGISQSDIDQAFDISRAFFEDEQEEEKRKVAAEGINIGASPPYLRRREDNLADPPRLLFLSTVDGPSTGDAGSIQGPERRPA